MSLLPITSKCGIQPDADLARVLALPRRGEPPTEALSVALRRPGSTAVLRPAQASALLELWERRGLFAPMRVGSGKTLVTLLAPTILAAQRPVLMVPASLRAKTRRDFAVYYADWHVRLPTIISYEEMGRPDRERRLIDLSPDLLILDEAHKARNLDAAVTRRVRRCLETCQPVVAALSGTLITDTLLDYHHLAVWALGDNAPVPIRRSVAERWGQALDRDVGMLQRLHPGALELLPGGFHEHFRTRRGVVPTPGSDCDASIQISRWWPELPLPVREAIEKTTRTGARPDDELLDELELPDCLSQLSLGFYYRWDPEPPKWWLRPRRAWAAYIRAVLDEHLDGLDSASQVVAAVERGDAPAAVEGAQLLEGWRAVKHRFTPNPVPVWLDRSIVTQAIKHAGTGTLIWTRYRAVGDELQRQGVPYFGGGTTPLSEGRTPIGLSIQAHGTGRNLQAWHRNLVLTPPANADAWEQLIGRTHRAGQAADVVEVSIIDAVPYHEDVISRVRSEARAVSKAFGFEHKLVIADWA